MIYEFGEGKLTVKSAIVPVDGAVRNYLIIDKKGSGHVGTYVINRADQAVITEESPLDTWDEISVKELNEIAKDEEKVMLGFKNIKSLNVLLYHLEAIKKRMRNN